MRPAHRPRTSRTGKPPRAGLTHPAADPPDRHPGVRPGAARLVAGRPEPRGPVRRGDQRAHRRRRPAPVTVHTEGRPPRRPGLVRHPQRAVRGGARPRHRADRAVRPHPDRPLPATGAAPCGTRRGTTWSAPHPPGDRRRHPLSRLEVARPYGRSGPDRTADPRALDRPDEQALALVEAQSVHAQSDPLGHLADAFDRGWVDEHGNVVGADFKTPAQGAATGLWAATSPLLDGRGGLYLEDCDIARVSAPDTPMDDGGVRAYAVDPDDAARLWDLSVAATGATPFTAAPGQPARRSAASGGRGRTPCEGPARGTPNQGLPRALPAREDGHRTVAAWAALRPAPRAPTVPARDHPLDHLPPGQTPPLCHRAPGPAPRPLPGTSAHLRPGPPVRRHARQPGRNTPAGLARRSLPQRPGTGLPVLPELCAKTSMPSPRGLPPPYSSGNNEGRITDLKLQKRIMAGRASVPLLRHRVVLIAHLRRSADRSTMEPLSGRFVGV